MKLTSWAGIARSLLIYYGQPWREGRRREFYGQFIRPGSLCFDVGSHLGDRIRTWRHLGGRVVAIEPQPACLSVLRRFYGRDPQVTILPHAIGAKEGNATLHVSEATPTVSTISEDWIRDVQVDTRFATVRWDRHVEVKVETLDQLIQRYGLPDFVKIDVEGSELEVLKGLSAPVPALSFEYLGAVVERSVACVERLGELGAYEFRTSWVETTRWTQPRWLSSKEITEWLRDLPVMSRSGDVYARLRP
jgi:FkbM family methyltransferase